MNSTPRPIIHIPVWDDWALALTPGLILPMRSGVVWDQQAGGNLSLRASIEGVYVPVRPVTLIDRPEWEDPFEDYYWTVRGDDDVQSSSGVYTPEVIESFIKTIKWDTGTQVEGLAAPTLRQILELPREAQVVAEGWVPVILVDTSAWKLEVPNGSLAILVY